MAHRILLGLLSSLLLIGMASVAHANSKASKTVLVYEKILGQPPTMPYSSTFTVTIAGLGYSSATGMAYGLSNTKQPNAATTGIGQLPELLATDGSGHPLQQDVLLGNANAAILPLAQSALPSHMAKYMKSVGASSGIFNFEQQVMVQGNPKPMYVVWQMIVDGNGRSRYGNAQLVPVQANFIYGNYVPLSVVSALPPNYNIYATHVLSANFANNNFSLPPPGNLQWYQVNQQLVQQTGPTNINLSGKYDAPTVNPNVNSATPGCAPNGAQVMCNPDYGLKCLINQNADPVTHAPDPSCPVTPINGFTSFAALENAQGASAGWLDYVRSLTPVYTTNPTNPAQQTAMVTVDVSSRVWQQQGGQLTCTSPNFYPASSPFGAGWNCFDAQGAQHYLFENRITSWGNSGNTGVSAGTGTALMEGTLSTLSHDDPGGNCHPPAVPGNYILLYQYVGYYNHGNGCRETEYYFISDGNQYTYSSPGSTSYMFFGNYGSPYIQFISGSSTFTATSSGSGSGPSGGTYTNSGTIGYQVTSVVDRYYVTPDGNYTLMRELTTHPSVPTHPYSKSVTLPAGATAVGYTNTIIDPFNTTQTYNYTNDTVNGLPATSYSVAPICLQSSVCP